MAFRETKIYNDGSHFIAIPKTTRPKRFKKPILTKTTISEKVDLKAEFEKQYKENAGKKKADKIEKITEELLPNFKDEETAQDFVRRNIERKRTNAIVRRTRLARKINLQQWNYFCTFTYDDKKHTEDTFRQKLSNCLKKLSYKSQWKYIGVWERSPKKKRLHFHGIFNIPNNTMPGELKDHKDYSFITHSIQTTYQNTYFNTRFGRSDFEAINDRQLLGSCTAYLMKYIEKSGERLVYSKGLPTYFLSDVLDEDIVCTIGQEDKKLLLFDDFNCWDEGCLIGKVSIDTINEMRKSN